MQYKDVSRRVPRICTKKLPGRFHGRANCVGFAEIFWVLGLFFGRLLGFLEKLLGRKKKICLRFHACLESAHTARISQVSMCNFVV